MISVATVLKCLDEARDQDSKYQDQGQDQESEAQDQDKTKTVTFVSRDETVSRGSPSLRLCINTSIIIVSELKLKDVLPFMIEKQISPALPNLSILYKIYLTLPVTSATAERSFSSKKA